MKRTQHQTLKERKKQIKVDQMNLQFPRALNVTEAVNAREFEVQAMESALKTQGKFAGNNRVFQTVPRHMRRRAASVNVKRLPKKFRQKALEQISRDPVHETKKQTRKMRRKPKRLLAEILSKPGCAKWLETHLWHAKRMKMVERWNMKLALHPNQKGVRFAYRSSASLSIIHDKSYMKVLEVRSTEEHLAMCFSKIADPTFPSVTASQYLNGRKQGSTILHEPLEYPFKCVAEVLFLWKPDINGKQRTIWLWINSDQYSLVFQLIVFVFQSMNCKPLQEFIYDRDFDLKRMDVENTVIKPLYQDLVRIEFTGPRSHAILSTCLTLDGTDSVAHRVWKSTSHLSTATCFPPSIVLGLRIEDPRICFPKLMQKKDAYDAALINKDELKSLFESWPHGAQDSTIWEEEIRDELLKARPSIGEINKRREKNVIPGTTLDPLESDVKVPILLIRRNVLGNHENSEATGGWDLIAPKGWSLPLWNLFIFAGARVGGLRDRNHILFEYGVPSYPDDYPETDSFINEKLLQSISSLEKYRRTPRAKRIDYIKKGVKSPFKQPFNDLIGEVQFGKLNLFHSSRTKSILQKCLNEDFKSFEEFSDELIQQINTLIMNKNLFFKNMITKNMNKMFCRVRLTLSSGKAESNAKIYLGSGDESDFDLVFIMLIKDSDIDEKLIIGYTTSGGYSHAAGLSAAIGTCSLNGLYKLFCKQNRIVLLRNRAGRKSYQCDLQLLE